MVWLLRVCLGAVLAGEYALLRIFLTYARPVTSTAAPQRCCQCSRTYAPLWNDFATMDDLRHSRLTK